MELFEIVFWGQVIVPLSLMCLCYKMSYLLKDSRRRNIICLVHLAVVLPLYFLLIKYPVTATVVDAETGKPIDGAIVMAAWMGSGFGMPGIASSDIVKVGEAVTDSGGKVRIDGRYCPNTSVPNLIVYKKGYVAWTREEIFQSLNRRPEFEWKSGYVFRLEKLDKYREEIEYIHKNHVSFIRSNMRGAVTTKLRSAIRWEALLAQEEVIEQERKLRAREKQKAK